MKKEEKDLTQKAVKKELRGYYYAGVHQYEGECDEDRFIDIVCCDQYGVNYESCYDGWDYIIQEVPDYEDVRYMASQIERLQEQLKEANDIIKEYVETTPKVPNDGFHIPNYNLDNAECYLKKRGVK